MGAGSEALTAALERLDPAAPRLPASSCLVRSDYEPWWAQRVLHRSEARFRVVVAGRGVGKTHACAWELLQLVLAAKPGAEGAVLAPTFPHAEAATAKLRELSAGIPGVEWRVVGHRLHLPGGRSIRVYSADRKESVRGPSLVALWLDEGAYLHVKAIEAALPALRGPGVTTRLLISTTPAGKNWIWSWWEQAATEPGMERFRFKATDSPFQDPFIIEKARQLMSQEKFSQEYLGEFIDSLLLVFPDRSELFVDSLRPSSRPLRCWLGVDLGRSSDFTVVTLMDEWGQAQVLGRWKLGSPGVEAERFWGQTDERVVQLARDRGAAVVVDTGGPGGAPGSVLAERLRGAKVPVVEVKTNIPGTKAKVIEQLKADVEWRKVTVLRSRAQPLKVGSAA